MVGSDIRDFMKVEKFKTGRLLMTRGVNDRVAQDSSFAELVHASLQRHLSGDWGDVCKEDKAENEFALKNNLRLFSVYSKEGMGIWIITEADRSATTILFPAEY